MPEVSDPKHQEFLDRAYPLIDQNAEPPGRWLVDKKWSGQSGWRTRHGDSEVRWSYGEPHYASNVLLADGTRIDVQKCMGSPSPFRYRLSGEPRRWLHGTIDIQFERVTFTPGEQPSYKPPAKSEHSNLEFDLAHDGDLRHRLADEKFADALYFYLQNGDFWKESGDRIWSCGMNQAGALVANLRGYGDTYNDYYPWGLVEPVVPADLDEIAKRIAAHGWRKATTEDKGFATEAIRREMASWEMRPEASVPDWAIRFQAAMVENPRFLDHHYRGEQRELMRRLHVLAISGRILESEFRSMYRRIYVVPRSPIPALSHSDS